VRPTAICAVTAAGLVLGACGGPSKNDAVNVATTWLKAVEQGDDSAACKLMDAKASRILAAKFARDKIGGSCSEIVAAYRDAIGKAKLHSVVDGGLEASGKVKDGRLGVFPKVAGSQYDIILMRFDGRRWTVESSGVG
jgi:hypothetical protein